MARSVSNLLLTLLLAGAVGCNLSSQLVVNDMPFLDEKNDIWNQVKEIIVKWLPGFIKSLPYPNQDIKKNNVHVETFDTHCTQFDIYEQDLNLNVIPGFPNLTAIVKTTVPYAEYQTQLNWRLYNCVWRFTCYGNNDIVTAKLYNFDLDLNATLDINPFDEYSKAPQIKSVYIDLTDMQLSIKAHWYSQWMYNTIFRMYGKEIDQKATSALNQYLQKEIKTVLGVDGDVKGPDFFQGELGEKLKQVASQYYALKQSEITEVVEM
eukprot:TRINITY_DN6122_c0_g1_i1.p2 TRINITY_DN6122_c0_g1~~TRINITY_DN6122_c0_g1_i1.p2  ORF type:complete len:296 (+),score=35.70 TRINITY_DN6122_c0_g1_i1:99-890(+)